MNVLAFKTQFGFEPRPAAVATSAVANSVYSTPAAFQETLDDMARLSYLKAAFRYKITQSAKPAAGAGTLKLTDGTNVYATIAVDFTSAQVISGTMSVDLSALTGTAALYVELDVTTAADAGTTAEVDAQLEVNFPMLAVAC